MNPPVVLIPGHSHLVAIETAQKHRQVTGQPHLSIGFLQLRKPDYRMDAAADPESAAAWSPAARALFADHPHAQVVSCIAGNAHTVLGLVQHPQPFDFVLDEDPRLPLDESRDILPCGVVRSLLAKQMQMGLRAMRALRALVSAPVWHLESPPPVGSAAHILAHADTFAAALAEHGLTPAFIRLKLWRLQCAMTRELCDELGFELIPAPPQALDSQGFLAEAGWYTDPAHGNRWYGEQVLRQLDARVSQVAGVPA